MRRVVPNAFGPDEVGAADDVHPARFGETLKQLDIRFRPIVPSFQRIAGRLGGPLHACSPLGMVKPTSEPVRYSGKQRSWALASRAT